MCEQIPLVHTKLANGIFSMTYLTDAKQRNAICFQKTAVYLLGTLYSEL